MFGTDDDTPAPQSPPAPPAPEPPPTADLPEVDAGGDGKDWSKVLVLAGGGGMPRGETRPVIVAEVRGDDGAKAADNQAYPKNADIYFRMDPDAQVGDGQLTLGVDVEQGLLGGLSPVPGYVHVGPAHPAYAAVNLATLKGATEVEVRGLSDFWKERLQPWFDGIAGDVRAPSDVVITLT